MRRTLAAMAWAVAAAFPSHAETTLEDEVWQYVVLPALDHCAEQIAERDGISPTEVRVLLKTSGHADAVHQTVIESLLPLIERLDRFDERKFVYDQIAGASIGKDCV